MTITDDKGEKFKITGIVGSNGEERLIDVNGYSVDAIISDNMLILENNDVPGVVGSVGRILGEENINIATMFLGRKGHGALMILSVDGNIEEKSIEILRNSEQVNKVSYLNLE